ncbi:MAG: peptidoglycan glycosyltransferase [Opitutia bacterium Tous-C1TDCM]|nr:MAG: peptidoglycan glycosyltransferase [Opitutae bacterium Tous-C1TDCM]
MGPHGSAAGERSDSFVESHKGYDPRIILFYFILAALLGTLGAGLAYRQLANVGKYADAERQQNQRRVLFPGPRGNIYDRHGQLLVGNNHRFAVLLHLDELKTELIAEQSRIRRNFVAAVEKKDVPGFSQLRQIARVTLVQRYLDQVNKILGRDEKVNAAELGRHFDRQLLLPYTLVDDLSGPDFARLIEGLPVRSPLEVYASNIRQYPFNGAAAHTLGYVRPDNEVEADGFPGEDLTTFKMKGTSGRDGLEKMFDAQLQGEAGGRIYRVDPTGFKINPPLESRSPKQGKHLVTSLDIDLQLVAEEAIGDQIGAAIAIDVPTGEVLVLASMPNYNLNDWYPRMLPETYRKIQERGAEFNYAVNGRFPPGSTYKILTSIAGLRAGVLKPDESIIYCDSVLRRFNGRFVCYNGREHHQEILLTEAIAQSCDIYYYEAGWRTTPERLAAESRRFHLDVPTGIELPERGKSIIPDPEWKLRERGEKWFPGDTANMSIGQGFVWVSPLQMACFTASVARNEIFTQPTLIHDPDRPRQRHESIGLTPDQRKAILDGMEGCVTHGTAKTINAIAELRIPGINILGKTGTAQIPGKRNVAWFIAFAPRENPQIAMAVALEGDTPGEEYGGGRNAAPIAAAVMKRFFEKRANPGRTVVAPIRSE